jgi:hypothetical protein
MLYVSVKSYELANVGLPLPNHMTYLESVLIRYFHKASILEVNLGRSRVYYFIIYSNNRKNLKTLNIDNSPSSCKFYSSNIKEIKKLSCRCL